MYRKAMTVFKAKPAAVKLPPVSAPKDLAEIISQLPLTTITNALEFTASRRLYSEFTVMTSPLAEKVRLLLKACFVKS